MPQPENVNPTNFTVDTVLFNFDDFSVVYGTWTPNGSKVIAMRWNDGDDGAGYPKAFGYPQWFIVSEEISRNILIGLLGYPSLSPNEYQSILDILKII